ncbi:polysaccharide deacetylase family protein [Acuticoccus mangrovi]|uniref:Chitooligosaccharide deacetylase n=1 Tax=Acuticoccus mangrovi TaxID=2796142 RepID=A0A934IMH0_9HYPH|nr:polysaccharide deacetylase [Acuticoccus mangrovi]MBJ3774615.1 polysaccharide deacetylase [Acuticoccus mangrovi]
MTHIACLTFDFDVWSGFAARDMQTPTPISRGEFGLVAARRILSLLKSRGVRSTWYVPGVIIDTHEADVGRVVEAGHEISHHGYSHLVPASMPPEHEEAEMVQAIEAIRRVSGRAPRGYRSPSWDLSPVTIDLLLKYGFDYDSSMMGDDFTPYFARRGDVVTVDAPFRYGTPTRLLEMPISWSLDDHPYFEFFRIGQAVMPGLANADMVLENFLGDFEYMRRHSDWGVLTYTFHPYVIGRGHRMLMLEKLIDRLGEMGATFMAMEDAADTFLSSRAAA